MVSLAYMSYKEMDVDQYRIAIYSSENVNHSSLEK